MKQKRIKKNQLVVINKEYNTERILKKEEQPKHLDMVLT